MIIHIEQTSAQGSTRASGRPLHGSAAKLNAAWPHRAGTVGPAITFFGRSAERITPRTPIAPNCQPAARLGGSAFCSRFH